MPPGPSNFISELQDSFGLGRVRMIFYQNFIVTGALLLGPFATTNDLFERSLKILTAFVSQTPEECCTREETRGRNVIGCF